MCFFALYASLKRLTEMEDACLLHFDFYQRHGRYIVKIFANIVESISYVLIDDDFLIL